MNNLSIRNSQVGFINTEKVDDLVLRVDMGVCCYPWPKLEQVIWAVYSYDGLYGVYSVEANARKEARELNKRGRHGDSEYYRVERLVVKEHGGVKEAGDSAKDVRA